MTQKSEIKNWSNAKGDGKLFSMTLMDESVSSRFDTSCFLVRLSERSFVVLTPRMSLVCSAEGSQSQIKATAFNEEVDNFFDMIEEGKVSFRRVSVASG